VTIPHVQNVRIRDANAADLPGLRALFLRARRETFVWLPSRDFELTDFDKQTRGELLLLAVDGTGRLLGFVSVQEPTDFIHHLFVSADHKRLGIGTALLEALPGWPFRRYQLKCLRGNQRALAFYRASGFAEVGAGSNEDGDYLLLERSGKPRA